MYKCDKCGIVLDELPQIQESRGECWGFPVYETVTIYDCYCTGEFEEVRKCSVCGKLFTVEKASEDDISICAICAERENDV